MTVISCSSSRPSKAAPGLNVGSIPKAELPASAIVAPVASDWRKTPPHPSARIARRRVSRALRGVPPRRSGSTMPAIRLLGTGLLRCRLAT